MRRQFSKLLLFSVLEACCFYWDFSFNFSFISIFCPSFQNSKLTAAKMAGILSVLSGHTVSGSMCVRACFTCIEEFIQLSAVIFVLVNMVHICPYFVSSYYFQSVVYQPPATRSVLCRHVCSAKQCSGRPKTPHSLNSYCMLWLHFTQHFHCRRLYKLKLYKLYKLCES